MAATHVTRTFTATDDAGNSSSATQTITVEDTTAPEFTSVPADYTVECSDEMPMDDATASDNCSDVSITVESETTGWRCRWQLHDCPHVHCDRRLRQQLFKRAQAITVEDTTAPELSIPADYTAECSDELILDDATATDNCGEVTIEVSSEDYSRRLRWQLHCDAHVHCYRRRWQQQQRVSDHCGRGHNGS